MAEPPRILPIFPLTGVVLLPLNWLPLHVFEPRYRALVEDALAGAGFIGMIQPLVPRDDNAPDPDAEPGDDPGHLIRADRGGRQDALGLAEHHQRGVVGGCADVEPADEVDPAVAAGAGEPAVVVAGRRTYPESGH